MELPEIRVYSAGVSPGSVDLQSQPRRSVVSFSGSETGQNSAGTSSKFRKKTPSHQSPQHHLCSSLTLSDDATKREGKVSGVVEWHLVLDRRLVINVRYRWRRCRDFRIYMINPLMLAVAIVGTAIKHPVPDLTGLRRHLWILMTPGHSDAHGWR